jgi:DNA-binding NarL/FixJ family response regulator
VSDIRIGGQPCLPVLRQLRADHPQLKIVGITGIDDQTVLRQVLAAGLNGLVFKSDPVGELLVAVLAVSAGGRYFSSAVQALQAAGRAGASSGDAEALARLTQRERQILKLVCSGISARLIAEELRISVWTVTNHKSNIMDKLGIRNQVGLTRFAIEAGLVTQGLVTRRPLPVQPD